MREWLNMISYTLNMEWNLKRYIYFKSLTGIMEKYSLFQVVIPVDFRDFKVRRLNCKRYEWQSNFQKYCDPLFP